MSLVQPTVEVWWSDDITSGDVFTLDDPVKGVLDSAFVLAEATPTDIADQVVAWSFDRGRVNALDEVSAGTLSLVVENSDGRFVPFEMNDPTLTDDDGTDTIIDDDGTTLVADSGIYGIDVVKPGRRIRMSVGGVSLFDGQIEDFQPSYGENGEATVTVVAADSFAVLARQRFDEWTTTALQRPGERIADVLNRAEVAFDGAKRDLDTGLSTLQSDVVSWGSNVLNYLQLVAASDVAGRVFMSRRGMLTYRRRTPSGDPAVTFADDGTGVPFTNIALTSSAQDIYNRVSVDREDGERQTVSDTDSQDVYGVRQLNRTGLLFSSDVQSLRLANYFLDVYSEPRQRVAGLTVWLDGVTPEQRGQVLGVDLGDVVRVVWTPTGVVGSTATDLYVEGIRHASSKRGAHEVALQLSRLPVQLDEMFILDSSELDSSDVLAY